MPHPELLLRRPKPRCRLSIILLDWGVRESFHSLRYLQNQTASRDDYEVLWLEFYRRQPDGLRAEAAAIDQWLVAGYDAEVLYHKHRLYNLGLLLAQGTHCVFCDSDAIFTPTFVEKTLAAFDETPRSVVHLDEIRNIDRRFYPFNFPEVRDILGRGCINWRNGRSAGLDDSLDMLHEANYGACMAASRDDLLAIGGADEHLDYLGYVCGPYDMTFRLQHHGLEERWLKDEYLYHVWHPNQSGFNTEYHGPHDGQFLSLRALESRALGRVQPLVENPWIAEARRGRPVDVDVLLNDLAEREEPSWAVGVSPPTAQEVFQTETDCAGFNIYRYGDRWYGLRPEEGIFDPRSARKYRVLLERESLAEVRHLAHYYSGLPKKWWQRLGSQPLYRLPRRAATRLAKEIARLF